MTSDEIKELTEYSDLEGTEIGELCWNLLGIIDNGLCVYAITKEFKKALENELMAQLNNFRQNSRIEITKERYKTRKIKNLVWK